MTHARLVVEEATIGYDGRTVFERLSTTIPDGSFTAVIGPNGCGKSTLLRALARVLRPSAGRVLLDGRPIESYPSKQVARVLGLLPQTSVAPSGMRVADLVARGRAPHQSLVQQWRAADEEAVIRALHDTRLSDLGGRLVDELSGGQRQRAWVAMLLAQQTPILLLDEPTTFLDIAHQFELLELLRTLHDDGKTVVTVLHDLGHAAALRRPPRGDARRPGRPDRPSARRHHRRARRGRLRAALPGAARPGDRHPHRRTARPAHDARASRRTRLRGWPGCATRSTVAP